MELKGHAGSVHQLCWDPTHPEHLATASADKTVKIWDARSKTFSYTRTTSNYQLRWEMYKHYQNKWSKHQHSMES